MSKPWGKYTSAERRSLLNSFHALMRAKKLTGVAILSGSKRQSVDGEVMSHCELSLRGEVGSRQELAMDAVSDLVLSKVSDAEIVVELVPSTGDAAPVSIKVIDPFRVSADKKNASPLYDFVPSGGVMFIDFWASWCGPCVLPMNHANRLAARHAEDWRGRVSLVAISFDDDHHTLCSAIEERGLKSIRHLWAGESAFMSEVGRAYCITGIPTAVIVDRDGYIAWRGHAGEIASQLETILERLAAGEPTDRVMSESLSLLASKSEAGCGGSGGHGGHDHAHHHDGESGHEGHHHHDGHCCSGDHKVDEVEKAMRTGRKWAELSDEEQDAVLMRFTPLMQELGLQIQAVDSSVFEMSAIQQGAEDIEVEQLLFAGGEMSDSSMERFLEVKRELLAAVGDAELQVRALPEITLLKGNSTCSGCSAPLDACTPKYIAIDCPHHDHDEASEATRSTFCAKCGQSQAVDGVYQYTSAEVDASLPLRLGEGVIEIDHEALDAVAGTPSILPHPNCRCDSCMQPIRGRRFRCAVCPDYDQCEECFTASPHEAKHTKIVISRPGISSDGVHEL